MTIYQGSDGRSYTLGDLIRRGGEGRVLHVTARPNDVGKIWHEPNSERSNKLNVLLRRKPEIRPSLRSVLGLAWPTVSLSDSRGTTVGFLMPKAPLDRYHELVNYCVPVRRRAIEASRGSPFSKADLLTIACHVALLFAYLHESGYVVGDVNHTNILAAPDGGIFLLDVDSVQVANPKTLGKFRCVVGKDDYTPPRLVGKRFAEVDRVVQDDLFGLSVLVFQLLMDGVHPYDSIDESGPPGHARAENIRRSNSPFARLDLEQAKNYVALDRITDTKVKVQKKAKFLASIEGRATADFATLNVRKVAMWLDLDPEIRELFVRAMEQNDRPEALDWTKALDKARGRKPVAKPPAPLPEPSRRPAKIPPAARTPTRPVQSGGFVSPSNRPKATSHGRPINQPVAFLPPLSAPETSPGSFIDRMTRKEKAIVLACFLLLALAFLHLVIGQGPEPGPSRNVTSLCVVAAVG